MKPVLVDSSSALLSKALVNGSETRTMFGRMRGRECRILCTNSYLSICCLLVPVVSLIMLISAVIFCNNRFEECFTLGSQFRWVGILQMASMITGLSSAGVAGTFLFCRDVVRNIDNGRVEDNPV